MPAHDAEFDPEIKNGLMDSPFAKEVGMRTLEV